MTIQTNKKLFGTMKADGPIHEVKKFGEKHYLILCRGFDLVPGHKVTLSDSKPTCRACAKVKQR